MIISSASCTTMSLLRVVCDQYFCPASSSRDKGDSDGDGRKEKDEGTSSRHGMIMAVVMVVMVLEVPCGMR